MFRLIVSRLIVYRVIVSCVAVSCLIVYRVNVTLVIASSVSFDCEPLDCVLPLDGVDRESGGELGHGTGRDIDKMSLPARVRRPDPPRLTVFDFEPFNSVLCVPLVCIPRDSSLPHPDPLPPSPTLPLSSYSPSHLHSMTP